MATSEIDNLTQRIAGLSPAKRALLELRSRKNGKASLEQTISERTNRGSAPLSFAQQRLWFLNQLEPESTVYNSSRTIRITGALNVESLHQALEAIVNRHEVLRTTFAAKDGEPMQFISEHSSVVMPILDLSALPEPEREAEVLRLVTAEFQTPFDLTRGPLMRARLLRLSEEEHVLALIIHHIISDGWSAGILFRELGALYEAFSTGQTASLPQLSIQYADYAQWQRQWLQGEVLEEQLSYWRGRLSDAPPVLTVPTDRPRPAVQSFSGAHQSLLLSREVAEGLKALSQREGVTLFMTLLAAFQTLLYRYTGQEDIVLGSPIANRNRAEIEGLIGFFVNTLVLRTDLSGNPTFRELLERVKEVALGAYGHQDFPFEKLVEELQPERDLSRSPLFQVMFAFQNAPRSALELSGLTLRLFDIEPGTAKFDIVLFTREEGDRLRAVLEYNTDLFEAERITRLLGHFEMLLESLAADPDQHLEQLPLLTEAERRQLLVEWNDTRTECSTNKSVVELFQDQVEWTPDAVAVVSEGELITYGQLNRRANQVAHYLTKLGVGPNVLVGVMIDRSIEMMVGLLGILKAGGAYVPLDPAFPKDRLAFMVADAEVPVLLTQQKLVESLPRNKAHVVRLDADWQLIAEQSERNPSVNVPAETLAYVIYTSGSTGKPKGVQVPHRAVANFLNSMREVPGITDKDVLLAVTTLSFDIAGLELYLPLIAGARIELASREVAADGKLLMAKLANSGATVMQATPATWRMLLEAGWTGSSHLKILCGGEALPRVLAEQLLDRSPLLWNLYGPTETTIWSTVHRVEPGQGSIPIGRPIANTDIYLLDAHLKPVPIGVPGELHIGGAGLALGYLNRPELTSEKFIPHPFSDEPGARLYKTGDLARYLPDGNIEYINRIDNQVKIRGYRIELEEIEGVLCKHQAVNDAVLIAKEDLSGDQRLLAYVVQNPEYLSTEVQPRETKQNADQISLWQSVWDEAYSEVSLQEDPTFNINGWNSSYTGRPIPAEEMRDWVNHTVERILSLQPTRVLEIGCGTGLLLFRIAPHCTQYCGTDFSQVTLNNLERNVKTANLTGVTFSQREASNFEEIEPDAYDTVIINSVAQYFPSVDYLIRVLEGAVRSVEAGGHIFLGDIRSLPLLEAFHASVELYQAPSSLLAEQLRQKVQQRLIDEKELVIDPAFFTALKQRLPKIGHVQILPKRGRHDNELTRFRYDVILHVGPPVASITDVPWLDGKELKLNLSSLRDLLEQTQPEILGIAGVPNARVSSDTQIMELIRADGAPRTVENVRGALRKTEGQGVDPEDLWNLSHELPYSAEISWTACDASGSYDVVFKRSTTSPAEMPKLLFESAPKRDITLRTWSQYANQPLAKTFFRELVPELRNFLKEKLPDYMVPSAFVLLDTIPLTPNGKVDRRALPTPDQTRPELERASVAPRNILERQLAEIWEKVLGIQPIGVKENFFDLGGHSLLAVRLFSQIEKTFNKNLPLTTLFQAPTIEQLADILRQRDSSTSWSSLIPIQTEGSKPPFFCIHAGGGIVLFYRDLSRRLGEDQPFYGLQAQGLTEEQKPLTSIEAMAAHYLSEIRTIQPEGPYYLGGACYGGRVAFEMAQQLRAQGQEVALLVMFDTYAPGYFRFLMSNKSITPFQYKMSFLKQRVEHHLGSLRMLDPKGKLTYIGRKGEKAWRKIKTSIKNGSETVASKLNGAIVDVSPHATREIQENFQLGGEGNLPEVYYPRLVTLAEAFSLADRSYVPRVYPGRLVLFKARISFPGISPEADLGWGKLIAGGIEIHEIAGFHGALVVEPRVRFLAPTLKECIERAQSTQSQNGVSPKAPEPGSGRLYQTLTT